MTLSDTAVCPGSTTVILTAIILFYVFFSFFNLSPLAEDAYIYFRFAENIASGHGYVFNPGGENIEGCYTPQTNRQHHKRCYVLKSKFKNNNKQ